MVSIIIANWNGRHWLVQCLSALQAQTYQSFEITIVDNGSTDGSVSWLQQNYPHIRLILNETNLGFAVANNQGIRAVSSKSQYIVTLNNDTKPDPTWLAELVQSVQDQPQVGMVASKIVLWTQPQIVDSTGIEVDWTGIAWNRGQGQAVEAFERVGVEDVFGPCAAAALYRRSMLAQIGLFDETFFAYYEDVDLAWRAQQAGWRCVYQMNARVLHWHSATGQQMRRHKIFCLGRNKWWTIFKNYPFPAILWTWPIILLYDFASFNLQLWQTGSLLPLQSRWAAIRHFASMIALRTQQPKPIQLTRPRLWP